MSGRRSSKTPVYIYALVNPVSEEVFYVGKSADLVTRWNVHMNGINAITEKNVRSFAHANCYLPMSQLKKLGVVPSLRVLQVCETDDAAFVAERKWTVALLEKGHPIKNGKNLKLGRKDVLRALAVNVRLTHYAEVAAELMESRECSGEMQQVAKMLRRALIDVDKLVEQF